MKIAIPAEGPTLDCHIASVFGRCPFMLLVDSKTMQIVGCRLRNADGDHGLRMARWICTNRATVLLTGSLGPLALEHLRTRSVRIVAGVQGTVREAVEGFVQNRGKRFAPSRPSLGQPTTPGHDSCTGSPGPRILRRRR